MSTQSLNPATTRPATMAAAARSPMTTTAASTSPAVATAPTKDLASSIQMATCGECNAAIPASQMATHVSQYCQGPPRRVSSEAGSHDGLPQEDQRELEQHIMDDQSAASPQSAESIAHVNTRNTIGVATVEYDDDFPDDRAIVPVPVGSVVSDAHDDVDGHDNNDAQQQQQQQQQQQFSRTARPLHPRVRPQPSNAGASQASVLYRRNASQPQESLSRSLPRSSDPRRSHPMIGPFATNCLEFQECVETSDSTMGESRHAVVPEQHTNTQEWSCPQCTLLNSMQNAICEVCNYNNQDIVVNSASQSARVAELTLDAAWRVDSSMSTENDAATARVLQSIMDEDNARHITLDRRYSEYTPPQPSPSSQRRHSTTDISFARSSGAMGVVAYPTPLGSDDFASFVEDEDMNTEPQPWQQPEENGLRVTSNNNQEPQTYQDGDDNVNSQRRRRFQPRSSYRVVQRRSHTGVPTTIVSSGDASMPTHIVNPQGRHSDPLLSLMIHDTLNRNVDTRHRFTNQNNNVDTNSPFEESDGFAYEEMLLAYANMSEQLGASEREIRQLPTQTLTDVCTQLPEDARGCQICLEDFQSGDQRKALPCLHGFHAHCVDKWLRSNACCPMCKFRIN